jgi:hypothetical protein
VTGVQLGDEVVEGDAVVIAMGPWSILAARWLPLPGVFGLKDTAGEFSEPGWVGRECWHWQHGRAA